MLLGRSLPGHVSYTELRGEPGEQRAYRSVSTVRAAVSVCDVAWASLERLLRLGLQLSKMAACHPWTTTCKGDQLCEVHGLRVYRALLQSHCTWKQVIG